MRILVLCVCYRNPAETASFVKNTLGLPTARRVSLAVTDNSGPSSDLGRCLPDGGGRVLRVDAPDNPGYFPGAARGLTHFLRREGTPDVVIVSNTDIAYPQPDILDRIGERVQASPCILAPSILSSESGADQNPYMARPPSRLRAAVRRIAFSSYPAWLLYLQASRVKRRFQPKRPPRPAAARPAAIYAAHGAFVVLPWLYFERGGNLETPARLFGEERHVSRTAARIGMEILYVPDIRVIHHEHSTTAPWTRFHIYRLHRAALSLEPR